MPPDMEQLRQHFAEHDYLFTLHASERAAQRGIRSREIEAVIAGGEVIEDYPDDKYGPSCLILGTSDTGRVLHIQVSYPAPIKVVTVYEPSADEWEADWKTRKSHE